MAAAGHAEDPDKTPAPPELDLAFQAENWGALPDTGGLLDQPAGLIRRMTVARNVYRAVKSQQEASSLAEWSINNPDHWRIVSNVRKLRKELEYGD